MQKRVTAGVTPDRASNVLLPGRYNFDAVVVGHRIETGQVVVTEEKIDSFAALSGDHFEIHMRDDAAQAKGFPGRVAHGLLVLSLIDGLKNQAPAQFDAIASLRWHWTFAKPVFVGDVLHAVIDIQEKRVTSRADRGILELDVCVRNQNAVVVQRGTNLLMIHR